jgi:hypothetical protein
MTIQPLTGILIAIVLALTIVTMGVWHYLSRGAWKHYAAGKSLMSLLGVQTAILTLAAATSWFGEFPGRPWAYIIVYLLLIGAQARIAWTIYEIHKHPDQ